ncbi:OmpA family protein [Enterovibrio paralichthyis]|uniref:OmpA family protein n=1 Tax=Enterovibrio paralichthyis TaxID=2853805 RepID=UPI0006D12D21|nr:OmpA family protein [Enterovibrio paralichthyis]MBV7296624.1 OmpA family protein [Enterovibrio paralichthyis]
MRKSIPVVTLIAASLVLGGCASNTGTGAAIGAATGAVLGKSTGNHKDKRIFIGAAIGALAGAAVGQYMDQQEAAFREELAGSGIQVVREGDNIRLVMPSNITFATNQSNISPSFDSTLDAVARVMNKYDKTFLSIDGHTDSTGDAAYNMSLSEKRAESVRNFLLRQGVNGQRMYVTGFGETQPIASNDSSAGRAANRRVEIQIVPNQA